MENAPNFEPRDFYFKNHVIFLLFSLPWFFPSLQLFLTKIIQKLGNCLPLQVCWVLPPTSPLKGPKVSRNFLKKMMVVLQTSQTKPTTSPSLASL